eukprot:NODE_7789_length_420_cov_303.271233.p3 GENE.NODE_7789_length_420_cov_303.271233~~NODE_7789_length_420_cov_303.271233.p3  ORF type:complete len:78 (+),score=11.10 NODE_7789_length_420_cov_303.271233:110-343(+)
MNFERVRWQRFSRTDAGSTQCRVSTFASSLHCLRGAAMLRRLHLFQMERGEPFGGSLNLSVDIAVFAPARLARSVQS